MEFCFPLRVASLSLSFSGAHLALVDGDGVVVCYLVLQRCHQWVPHHTTATDPKMFPKLEAEVNRLDSFHSGFPCCRQQSVQTNQTNKFGNGVPLVRFVIHLDNLIAASIDHRSFSLSSSSLMGPASQRRKKGWQLRFFNPGGWRSCRFLVRRSVMRPEGDIRCCQGG